MAENFFFCGNDVGALGRLLGSHWCQEAGRKPINAKGETVRSLSEKESK
jgi:hypothetical protein